jgi:hypothetical protein
VNEMDPAYKQEVKVIFQIISTARIPIETQSIKDISKKHTKFFHEGVD